MPGPQNLGSDFVNPKELYTVRPLIWAFKSEVLYLGQAVDWRSSVSRMFSRKESGSFQANDIFNRSKSNLKVLSTVWKFHLKGSGSIERDRIIQHSISASFNAANNINDSRLADFFMVVLVILAIYKQKDLGKAFVKVIAATNNKCRQADRCCWRCAESFSNADLFGFRVSCEKEGDERAQKWCERKG